MSQQSTERNGSIGAATQCSYTFDPARRTDASLRTTWECPHPAHEESDYCVFHMSADERAAHDVDSADVAERLLDNLAVDDPRRNEYVGASLPHLSLTYRQVDGDTNHVLNFQHAEIEGIDLTHGRLDQGLNLREATVRRLTLEDATVTGDVDVSDAVVEQFEASEGTFREDVDFSGVTFTGSVDCTETRFDEGAAFDGATFEGVADFRNVSSAGDSHVLDDHLTFAAATFHDAAKFRQASLGYVSFAEATFEASTDFEHVDFEGDTRFDGATFERIADFDEARFDHDASFTGTQFRRLAEFRGVRFDGGSRTASDDVTFENAVFEDEADFKLATFRFADFKRAECRGELNFDRAVFRARADCHDLAVAGVTNLERTTFEEPVVFDGSTFGGRVVAQEATFEGDADFVDARFTRRATFDEARFRADVDFGEATFEATASFCGAAFEGEANHVEQNASFDGVAFEGDADFRDARFTRGSFRGTTFDGTCDFRAATFREAAAFELVPGGSDSYVDLTDAVVSGGTIVEGGAPVPYDLTRATLGDVRLEGSGDGHELLDHFRFCLTEFDEFDFSDHHAYLERNDWTIHDFVENDATGSYAVPLTNETIEETYRKAQDSANAVGDTPASREFEFKRYYYNRQKNADILLNEYSLNAWGRVKKTASVGLNYVMQVTCGYGNRLPRIAAWTFLLPALFGVLYVLGGPFLTQAGSIVAPGPDTTTGEVLFNGLYYSYISFSTIGYGDIGPVGWAAKLLAASQGMLNGLFFTLLTFTLFKRVLGGS
ncbi:pentapeptide repeat-containing protein [Salinigranum halophilum]|uniref:pentapeptide repeat-containing protein n=1 Tax=Salinigranum halophilum TaxID=2565931 RepID=UPI0010A766D0|nr:pentapeptide repeat-containing protein [Salinigranum halophilum]